MSAAIDVVFGQRPFLAALCFMMAALLTLWSNSETVNTHADRSTFDVEEMLLHHRTAGTLRSTADSAPCPAVILGRVLFLFPSFF